MAVVRPEAFGGVIQKPSEIFGVYRNVHPPSIAHVHKLVEGRRVVAVVRPWGLCIPLQKVDEVRRIRRRVPPTGSFGHKLLEAGSIFGVVSASYPPRGSDDLQIVLAIQGGGGED